MKKYFLLITGLFLFAFINSSFAAGKILPFDWGKKHSLEELGGLMEACPIDQQDESEPKATITNITGLFQILRTGGIGEWEDHFNDPKKELKDESVIELKSGDKIRTRGGSSATLNFSDGSSIVLGVDTSITYRETETITKIELLLGKLRVIRPTNLVLQLKTKIGPKLETKMRVSAACVRGTDFIMEQTEDINTSRYYLYEGTLDIVNLNGETTQLNPGDIATITSDSQMTLGKLDQEKWNQLVSEISLVEISEQVNGSTTAKQEDKKPAWLWPGLIVTLLCVAGAGVFLYRKRS